MERNDDKIKRVAIELDRLEQEVRTLQRLLDENRLDNAGEMSRLLRYLATSAERVAVWWSAPAVPDRVNSQR